MGNTHDSEFSRIQADYIGNRWKSMKDFRWGYCKNRGPTSWWIYYPSASGGNQSPVDISTDDFQFDDDLTNNPLAIYYSHGHLPHSAGKQNMKSTFVSITGHVTTMQPSNQNAQNQQQRINQNLKEEIEYPAEKMQLINNGTTSIIRIFNSNSYICGGPCDDSNYVLDHVVLHWGENDTHGSEHTVNSRPYSAEVQLVHWNEELYDCYEEAAKRDDGIVIISIFAKLSDSSPNKILQLWSKLTEDTMYRDQQTTVNDEIDIKQLLPNDTMRYWSYAGSFTCPPCYEVVTWIVFSTPIFISSSILKQFRRLKSYSLTDMGTDDEFDGQILSNIRPIQPLGTRKIYCPEIESSRRQRSSRAKHYELSDPQSVRISIFPELFDPQRREDLFKWLQ